METKANYVLIGAFTLGISIFLLLFALWAAKFASDRTWQRYDVIFTEPVTGLTEGSSVQYNGISVGIVEKLKLDATDPRRVLARLKLNADVPVKTDTKAKMSQAGLTGSPFIQLTGGMPSSPMLVKVDQREVPVIQTEPSALQNIADTANKLVARMDKLLSEENIKRIEDTLENLRAATGAIGDQKEDIRALLINARQASEQLKSTLSTVDGAVVRLDREVIGKMPATLDKLDHAIGEFDSAGKNANALIAENRGPIKSFTGDGLQQISPAISELRVLIRDLRRISNGIDRNPAGYILGRQQQPKEFTPK